MSPPRQDCVNASADPVRVWWGRAEGGGGTISAAVTIGTLDDGRAPALSGACAAGGSGEAGTTSTGAMKRYPLPDTVSTNTGASGESCRACRILRMAVWTPVSTSTNTSLPHSRSTISLRETS